MVQMAPVIVALDLCSKFAKSLSAINMCSYVLGVNNCYLENFVLDMSTGGSIPIDFSLSTKSTIQQSSIQAIKSALNPSP